MSNPKLGNLVVAGLLLVPALSMADSPSVRGQASPSSALQPQPGVSATTRDEVSNKLREAQRDGSFFQLHRNGPKVPGGAEPQGSAQVAMGHGSSGKSREAEDKRRDQTQSAHSRTRPEGRNAPASAASERGKTRQEVMDEYLRMTPEEKQRLQELYPGG